MAIKVRFIQHLREEAGTGSFGPLHYGWSAGLEGDTLAIGAPESTAMAGNAKGIVFLYRREGGQWVSNGSLVTSDRDDSSQSDPEFGTSLALDENTLVVGAPGADDPQAGQNSGAVYIFQRRESGWEQTGILRATDGTSEARFGSTVQMRGDLLAVGEGYPGQAVYVFGRQGDEWLQQARLVGENLGEEDVFGYKLALDQNRLAVTSWDIDPQRQRLVSSAVYVYRRQGQEWALETKLTQETPSGMFLGSSMVLEGDTLVVGSGDSAAGILAGAVLIYEYGTQGWQQQARLVPADGAYFTAMGSSVDLQGDLLVVGAGGDSSDTYASGSAYLFARQGDAWIDVLKIKPSATTPGYAYGTSVMLSGSDLLVTAPDEFGGPVYMYAIERP